MEYTVPSDDGYGWGTSTKLTATMVDPDAVSEAQGSSLFSFFIPHFGYAIEFPPVATEIASSAVTATFDVYVTTKFKLYGYRTNRDNPASDATASSAAMQVPAMADMLPES